MATVLFIPVKESLKQLKQDHKKASNILRPRILMLIEMKKAGSSGISKRELVDKVGASGQSIQTWRTSYKTGGLTGLMQHNKGGYKPSSFNDKELSELKKLMNNPKNNIAGYKELQKWIKAEFKKEIKYNTLLKFMISKFKTGIKVTRKVHALKSEQRVGTFKKTSHKSARKP